MSEDDNVEPFPEGSSDWDYEQQKMYEQGDLKEFFGKLPKKFWNRSDAEINEAFLRLSPAYPRFKDLLWVVTQELDCSEKRIFQWIKKNKAREEAKILRQELIEKTYKDKIPLLKEVIELSLGTLRDFLLQLRADPVKFNRITPQDAKALAGIAKDFNELLRLELGQSTANVSIEIRPVDAPRETYEDWIKRQEGKVIEDAPFRVERGIEGPKDGSMESSSGTTVKSNSSILGK